MKIAIYPGKYFFIFTLLTISFLSTLMNLIDIRNIFFYREALYISICINFFIFLFYLIRSFKPLKITINLVDLSLIAFYVYHVIHILFFTPLQIRSYDFVLLSTLTLFYFVIKHFFSEEQSSETLPRYIALMAVVLNLLPVIISILEYFDVIPKLDNQFDISGGFVNPGALANFMVPFFPLLLSILLLAKNINKFIRTLVIITVLASFIVLLITNARAAWLSGVIASIYVLCFYPKFTLFVRKMIDTKLKKVFACFILAIFIAISIGFLYSYKQASSEGRLFIWKTCFGIIREKPLFGNGYNSFIKTYNDHQVGYFMKHPEDIENGMLTSSITFPCNDYLQIAIEVGLIGLVLFSGIIFFVFRCVKPIGNRNDYLVIGMKAGLMAMLICALFSYPFKITNCLLLFYFFIAYLSSTIQWFTISIPVKVNYVISFSIILLSMFFLVTQLKVYQTNSTWEKAYNLAEEKNNQKALELYSKVEPEMNSNFYFLYNYGAFLYNTGNLNKSLDVLLKAGKIQTNFELYMNIANIYERLALYDKAEEYFIKAINLIPHKFMPKYNLLKLYINTRQVEKAHKIAMAIKSMPIKVYSPTVGQIKKDAIDYLKNN